MDSLYFRLFRYRFSTSLSDFYPRCHPLSVYALQEIGNSPAVTAIITALKDQSVYVREAAILALQEIGDRRAMEPLAEMLAGPDIDFSARAANALASWGYEPETLT